MAEGSASVGRFRRFPPPLPLPRPARPTRAWRLSVARARLGPDPFGQPAQSLDRPLDRMQVFGVDTVCPQRSSHFVALGARHPREQISDDLSVAISGSATGSVSPSGESPPFEPPSLVTVVGSGSMPAIPSSSETNREPPPILAVFETRVTVSTSRRRSRSAAGRRPRPKGAHGRAPRSPAASTSAAAAPDAQRGGSPAGPP